MRVRKITNRGTKKVIGKFPSLKLNKTVWWESQIERDYIYLLEFDPDVLFYQEQPLQLCYHSKGKERHYTPDFLVGRPALKQIVEVKPKEKVAKEENALLFQIVAPLFEEEGFEFLVVDDAMIRVQPRLNNIKLFLKYARTWLAPQHYIYCHEFLHNRLRASLGETFQFFESKHIPRQVVYALIYQGILVVDLMEQINADTFVYLRTSTFTLR